MSLVLGLLSITCIVALPIISLLPALADGVVLLIAVAFLCFPLAFLFGIAALRQIRKSWGGIIGRGRAMAGLIIGGVGVVLIVAMLVPALASAREKARLVQCLHNMQQISLAIGVYAEAHDGYIPRKFDDLRPYAGNLDNLLICPSAKDTSRPSYQIILGGSKWERWNTNDSMIDAIVVIENASDHRIGQHALYNDGHVSLKSNGRNH